MSGPVAIYKLPYIEEIENSKQEYGIDYGGSLLKLIYRAKENDPNDNSTLSCAVFTHDDHDGLAEFIKKKVVLHDDQNASLIHTTGVGIKKYGPKLEQLLSRKFKHYNEMDCFGKAIKVLLPSLSKEDLYYPVNKEGFDKAMTIAKEFMKMGQAVRKNKLMESDFFGPEMDTLSKILNTDNDTLYANYDTEPVAPGLIVMGSSGFAASKYNEDYTLSQAGYSSRGGRTLMGLGSLLTRAKDYEELMELAANGDNGNVDILIKFLKAGAKDDVYGLFPDNAVCFNFGHAYGKTIDDFRREDLAAAVVYLSCDDLANFAINTAIAQKCKTVTIAGTIINHEIARRFITEAFVSRSFGDAEQQLVLRMTKLGPYIGAVGVWEYGRDYEKSDKK